ncbi:MULTISPECIES: hypothetical protein [Streptomyces]|uniref:hypothetical protein n=1 Tax=Streptomyces TaxID=1883 RepID=UPI00114CEEDB|nr:MULTISPECIES: hypothetical protein [unclassified Streptomyces]MYT12773.1 hypothetical protein [Streptomyces sp. SID4951]
MVELLSVSAHSLRALEDEASTLGLPVSNDFDHLIQRCPCDAKEHLVLGNESHAVLVAYGTLFVKAVVRGSVR